MQVSTVFMKSGIAPWVQSAWRRYILPALICYGMSRHGRYSDAFVVRGSDLVFPRR